MQFGHDRTGSDGGIPLEAPAAVAHQQRDPDIQNAKVPLQGAFIPSAEYALLPMSGSCVLENSDGGTVRLRVTILRMLERLDDKGISQGAIRAPAEPY
jgi:hypothetical protein